MLLREIRDGVDIEDVSKCVGYDDGLRLVAAGGFKLTHVDLVVGVESHQQRPARGDSENRIHGGREPSRNRDHFVARH